MALTITTAGASKDVESLGSLRASLFTITFDSSYATGGEALAASDLGLKELDIVMIENASGYVFNYDHSNNKVIARTSTASFSAPSTAGVVADDDSAATNGADLQVGVADILDDDGTAPAEQLVRGPYKFGYFSAINAGNATISDNEVGNGGPTFTVVDNDNAETETDTLVDLFVAPAGGGFYAATKSGTDLLIPLSNGEFILVQYDADPATNQSAVQVYFDDDAANAYERLLT